MEKVKLTKEMTFLKCFDKEGNLLGTHADVEKKGSLVILRVGTFKQTIHIDKYKKMLAINGSYQDAELVDDSNDNLEEKSKEELQEMAKNYYVDGEIDGRLGKPKLIELIRQAKG